MREESERAVDAGELAHCLMITSQIVHSTVDDVDIPLSSMFSLFCLYPTALLFRTAQLVTPVFGLSPELTPRALVFVHVRCLLPRRYSREGWCGVRYHHLYTQHTVVVVDNVEISNSHRVHAESRLRFSTSDDYF